MQVETPSRAEVWSQYWALGGEHSCGGSYKEGYGETIAQFWRSGFESLPLNARVLDIGTGNGPLPRILISIPARLDLVCDAIDLASVAPTWHAQLSDKDARRVSFHSRCAAEQLPFEAETFDLVVSQWGLEYSDMNASLSEVLRVLKPMGRVQLVLHHKDSLPVRLAHRELAHLDWLLRKSGFLTTAEQMLSHMALAAEPGGVELLKMNASANALRSEFNQLQDQIQVRLTDDTCPDVLLETRRAIAGLFEIAFHSGFSMAKAGIDSVRQQLLHSELRLRDLCQHALDEASVRALAERLSGESTYELGLLEDQDATMAWTLKLRKT